MGNVGSNCFNCSWRRGGGSNIHPQQRLYAGAYTSQYANPPPPHAPYFQIENGARWPPPPHPTVPLPESHDDYNRMAMDRAIEAWVDGCYPPTPYADHQTITIKNDVNLKKETLKIEADEENPGKSLVSFTFDATVPCSITLYFFAKEGKDGNLTEIKEDSLPPLTVSFQQGLGQIFRQKPGTGIDLSMFKESDLCKRNETSTVYPLSVKLEATLEDENLYPGDSNFQITEAVFEKDKGDKYKVKVEKQILWMEGVRYDLQEIYGIANTVDGSDYDGTDPGKECVICLSEPPDTMVLPCRHMCMCHGCAKVLRFQTKQCPICRQPAETLWKLGSTVEPQI
ncbi:hypothetical protein L2E82_05611 [Cichorium intybus]|uniref:Uncharacterized protein n=1 Tax=Cichorium intybus TaxID=13427 RepID=A0ACB9H7S5_CICIN|nr:hypothetical protein L2E82_05611 [Cichorium intybus]